MKKFLLCAFMFVFVVAFSGCNNTKIPEDELETIKEEFEKTLMFETFGEKIDLPTSIPDQKGSKVKWQSFSPDVIDDEGNVVGLDSTKKGAEKITLSYNATVGSQTFDGMVDVVVYYSSLDEVAEKFKSQFSVIITRNYDVITNYYDAFNVEWHSSNQQLFDDNGRYFQPANDTIVTVNFTVSTLYGTSKNDYSVDLNIQGMPALQKVDNTYQWLLAEGMKDLYLSNDITLPTKYDLYNTTITWKSSDPSIVSPDGKVTHYVFERYVTLTAVITLDKSIRECLFECIVEPLDLSKMTEDEILENFLQAIAVDEYHGVNFNSIYDDINQSFGFLNFYENKDAEIEEMILPQGQKNRPGIKRKVELVVVHDTGNNGNGATARANASYVYSGYSGQSTGWHYTVGNDGIFRTIPDDEVAYHANGEADTPFNLIPTGIKATAKKPNAYISAHYLYINGEKTNISVPDEDRIFASDGPMVEVVNGEYYVDQMWYCSGHGYNANIGGNASGIGIESAVNPGTDYATTCRKLAKLIAELLIKHGLNPLRIVQHNTMSGKDCPKAIRDTHFWYNLKDMVSLEKFAKENLSSYQFTWTSNSTNVMDNTGKIAKDLNGVKSVSYSVSVTKNGTEVLSKNYTTNLVY